AAARDRSSTLSARRRGAAAGSAAPAVAARRLAAPVDLLVLYGTRCVRRIGLVRWIGARLEPRPKPRPAPVRADGRGARRRGAPLPGEGAAAARKRAPARAGDRPRDGGLCHGHPSGGSGDRPLGSGLRPSGALRGGRLAVPAEPWGAPE